MHDTTLYVTILGIQPPWTVTAVTLDREAETVTVRIAYAAAASVACPECGDPCPRHDRRRRRWRHLDTCQYRTILEVAVPRARCAEHGVHQIRVPWGEAGSAFTALFEAVVIDWLLEASLSAVARQLRVTWDQVDGIRARAVRRGLARRQRTPIPQLGVDETSFQKRHEYVTVVTDLAQGHVLHVADGRSQDALEGFYVGWGPERCAHIEAVAMDMWTPYIQATQTHVPEAARKIAFDRFHVAKHLGKAVDTVRKQEHRALRAQGEDTLTRTKYLWLQNPENMTDDNRDRFEALRDTTLKVARAWAIKETARDLWRYVKRGWAEKAWRRWLGWAMRARLQPIKQAARTVRDHLWGILNAVVLHVTNAMAESRNAKIQWVKKQACGFRNRDRFRDAIYFHCGGLDLYPEAVSTHTNS